MALTEANGNASNYDIEESDSPSPRRVHTELKSSSWTLWKLRSKNISKAIKQHEDCGSKYYSSLAFAFKVCEEFQNLKDNSVTLSHDEFFQLVSVPKEPSLVDGKVVIDTFEMKVANNFTLDQSFLKFKLIFDSDLATLIKNILQPRDLILTWGGRMIFRNNELVIEVNCSKASSCTIIIISHNEVTNSIDENSLSVEWRSKFTVTTHEDADIREIVRIIPIKSTLACCDMEDLIAKNNGTNAHEGTKLTKSPSDLILFKEAHVSVSIVPVSSSSNYTGTNNDTDVEENAANDVSDMWISNVVHTSADSSPNTMHDSISASKPNSRTLDTSDSSTPDFEDALGGTTPESDKAHNITPETSNKTTATPSDSQNINVPIILDTGIPDPDELSKNTPNVLTGKSTPEAHKPTILRKELHSAATPEDTSISQHDQITEIVLREGEISTNLQIAGPSSSLRPPNPSSDKSSQNEELVRGFLTSQVLECNTQTQNSEAFDNSSQNLPKDASTVTMIEEIELLSAAQRKSDQATNSAKQVSKNKDISMDEPDMVDELLKTLSQNRIPNDDDGMADSQLNVDESSTFENMDFNVLEGVEVGSAAINNSANEVVLNNGLPNEINVNDMDMSITEEPEVVEELLQKKKLPKNQEDHTVGVADADAILKHGDIEADVATRLARCSRNSNNGDELVPLNELANKTDLDNIIASQIPNSVDERQGGGWGPTQILVGLDSQHPNSPVQQQDFDRNYYTSDESITEARNEKFESERTTAEAQNSILENNSPSSSTLNDSPAVPVSPHCPSSKPDQSQEEISRNDQLIAGILMTQNLTSQDNNSTSQSSAAQHRTSTSNSSPSPERPRSSDKSGNNSNNGMPSRKSKMSSSSDDDLNVKYNLKKVVIRIERYNPDKPVPVAISPFETTITPTRKRKGKKLYYTTRIKRPRN